MNEHPKPFFFRFRRQEQILLCKRLAMLSRSGISLVQGLTMLDENHKSRSSAYLFGSIIDNVSRGVPLSQSMIAFENIFGAFAIDIIKVGEVSGTLPQNLDYLAEELKKSDALRKKVLGALVYPAVIALATVGIALVLTVYIFPKITPIFESFKQQLPFSTRVLITVSHVLIADGVWLIGALAACAIVFVFLFKKTDLRRFTDRITLRAPIFGNLSRAYHTANAARSLSILLKADLSVVKALEIAAHSARNTVYQNALSNMAQEVARGQKLSVQMRKFPRLFSPLCAQMLRVGEETGALPDSLMYLSDMYEEDIADLTKNLATLLEPALMLTMGAIVGFIAISIITPIYGITQNLTPH